MDIPGIPMITKIVVHCSDTPDDRDIGAADIHSYHLRNGWDGIGYHYVIRRCGLLERGRPEYWQGAHAKGHNKNSIAVCLIGRNAFTDAQFKTLHALIDDLRWKYPGAKICGHGELDSRKTCPNFDVQAWLASITNESDACSTPGQ